MTGKKDESREIDLMDYWRIVVKRKWVIIIFFSTVVFFMAAFSFLTPPKYESTATLLIEEGTSRILSINEAFGSQIPFVQDLRFFNTQLELLKSRLLAERVAKRLNVLSRSEFRSYINKISVDKTPENQIPSDPYSYFVDAFQKNLKVKPLPQTKLIKVSFISASRNLAYEICQTTAEEFRKFSIESRYELTTQASDYLRNQIAAVRDDLEAKQKQLQKYGQEKNLYYLSETESTTLRELDDLNKAYTQAQIDRTIAEASYLELKGLDINSITQSNNPLIQQLRSDYTKIKNEYDEKRQFQLPNHPEMLRLKAKLDSMKEELNKAVNGAEAEYRSALKREDSLRILLNGKKAIVSKMNTNAILYQSLKSEVENKRKLLNSLDEKLNETLVSEKLGSLEAGNITVVDPASIPEAPVSPKKALNLILAFFMGIFGGIGLCFIFEYLDDTIKGPDEAEALAGLPSLGLIPYLPPEGTKKSKSHSSYIQFRYSYGKSDLGNEHTLPEIKEIELVNHSYPESPLAEDYRTIRTSILLSYPEKPPKTIAFSSALAQEGKTATAVNMAVSFAQLKDRVLVIETDLRKPRLQRIFKLKNVNGISTYLTGKVPLKEIIYKTFIENIWLVPSGPLPPNPAELLSSGKIKDMLKEMNQFFDIVLLDSPPVLAVIDSVIISSIVDATVIVVRAGKTRRKPFLSAIEELVRARAKLIGVIFNGVNLEKEGSYYSKYHRYYKYGLYGKEEQETPQDSQKNN
jgi:capsular exopolysaccharide synthesis family protein